MSGVAPTVGSLRCPNCAGELATHAWAPVLTTDMDGAEWRGVWFRCENAPEEAPNATGPAIPSGTPAE